MRRVGASDLVVRKGYLVTGKRYFAVSSAWCSVAVPLGEGDAVGEPDPEPAPESDVLAVRLCAGKEYGSARDPVDVPLHCHGVLLFRSLH